MKRLRFFLSAMTPLKKINVIMQHVITGQVMVRAVGNLGRPNMKTSTLIVPLIVLNVGN